MSRDSDYEEFDRHFKDFIDILVSEETDSQLAECMEWIKEVAHYNVTLGKRNRGTMVVKTYKQLMKEEYTPEDIKLVHIIGWCLEMFQAFFLMHDDIMDHSLVRRGVPCWYKKSNVGLNAINDGVLMEQGVYVVLRRAISHKPYYRAVMDLFLKIGWTIALGQCLDVTVKEFKFCTPKRFSTTARHKTGYYSFCMPIQLASYMAGKDDAATDKVAEEILLEIGELYQAQDDYFDCFGDPAVTKKIGTDIQDGKCSWPLVKALQLSSKEQWNILQENYGKDNVECVNKVKEVYRELDISTLFHEYEEQSYTKIMEMIEESKTNLPKKIFVDYLNTIHRRKF